MYQGYLIRIVLQMLAAIKAGLTGLFEMLVQDKVYKRKCICEQSD